MRTKRARRGQKIVVPRGTVAPGRMLCAVLLAPFALLCVVGILGRSEIPTVLGRYSPALFGYLLVSVAAMAGILLQIARPRITAIGIALICAGFGLSFFTGASNAIQSLSFNGPLVHLCRFGLALILVIQCALLVLSSNVKGRVGLGLGVCLLMFSACDASAALFQWGRAKLSAGTAHTASAKFKFRGEVALNAIEPDSLIVIGDSMVWGQGVHANEAFATLLGDRLTKNGISGKVYNLGQVGTALNQYIEVARDVPAKGRAIICFYMNDMPERQTVQRKILQAVSSLGRNSPIIRALYDILQFRDLPDIDRYEASVIANFDKKEQSYAKRWKILSRQFEELFTEANRGAQRPPLLVLIPMMWDFSRYPLADAHREIAELASGVGYEVIDLLPSFTARFPNGKAYVVTPNDNHFKPEVHAFVANYLAERLMKGPGANRAISGAKDR